MSTTTKPKRRNQSQKQERYLRLLQPFDENGKNAEIQITIRKGRKTETTRYWLDRQPADWGMAFLFEKQGDGQIENAEYHVLLDHENGHSCECRGFLGIDRCKHIEALVNLEELGKL